MPGARQKLTKVRHPEWEAMHEKWISMRLAYEGGDAFIEAKLQKFSKREPDDDFKTRKSLTYNPAHTTLGVNVFRNSLMAKIGDVQRTGDARYIDAMNNDVDLQGSSMGRFMGMEVAPLLLSTAKRIVCLDAPAVEGVQKSEDRGKPYMWTVDAENMVAWAIDDDTDEYKAAVFYEKYDVVDPELMLTTSVGCRYRFMAVLEPGSVWKQPRPTMGGRGTIELTVPSDRKQVLLRLMDERDVDMQDPLLIDIPRLPISVGHMSEALLKDVAKIQEAALNLCSTDMSFLWKGNFPQQVQQVDLIKRSIRPQGSKRPVKTNQEVELADRTVEDVEFKERKEVGPNRALVFGLNSVAPSYIAPPTDNCRLSMEKQASMAQEIKTLLDQGMVSIGKNQVEQSGLSKQMDRLGVDTGLQVLAKELERMEREIAEIYHMLLGVNTKSTVNYPKDFTVRSQQDRLDEAGKLNEVKKTVRSKTFQNEIDKQRVMLMEGPIPANKIDVIKTEIDTAPWVDFDPDRATTVQGDVLAGLCSKSYGSKLRMYPEGEADAAQAERIASADLLAGSGFGAGQFGGGHGFGRPAGPGGPGA